IADARSAHSSTHTTLSATSLSFISEMRAEWYHGARIEMPGGVMPHTFDDWFPERDYPSQGVVGAYTWLTQRGYGNPVAAMRGQDIPRPRFRRLLVVGLIYREGLVDAFIKTCWIQGCRSDAEKRARMDQFYRWFNNRPNFVRWLAHI
ncbi:MAG: hypothetical protein QUS09_09200, partial [Methanotrichaceae archaeon]|nr:hypothetical protein [Methanotrichaceae archaeon]